MKAATLRKRIATRLTTKDGALKKRYEHIWAFILHAGTRYHGKTWRRSGRHVTLEDSRHRALREALDLLGLDYATGNDAPRGGAEGDYIELAPKGLRQTRELREGLIKENNK